MNSAETHQAEKIFTELLDSGEKFLEQNNIILNFIDSADGEKSRKLSAIIRAADLPYEELPEPVRIDYNLKASSLVLQRYRDIVFNHPIHHLVNEEKKVKDHHFDHYFSNLQTAKTYLNCCTRPKTEAYSLAFRNEMIAVCTQKFIDVAQENNLDSAFIQAVSDFKETSDKMTGIYYQFAETALPVLNAAG